MAVTGLVTFAVLASLSAIHLAVYQDRPWALLALLAVPIGGAFVLRQPWVTAGCIIVASTVLMLGYTGIGYSDQTDLGRAAFGSILDGQSPYRIHDLGTHTNPFAYGPLAMLTAQLWPLELVSAIGLLGVLAWSRSWITLGFMAGFPPFVNLALTGLNDYTPALLIVSALLALRTHPRLGMGLLAVSAAVKPYAAAWFLPAFGFAGWSWMLVGVSAVLWAAPMAIWAGDFLAMIRHASGLAGFTPLRLLAPPLAIAGLFARRWDVALLLGAGVFATTMLFGQWASLGYWIVLLPVVGLALELGARERLGAVPNT